MGVVMEPLEEPLPHVLVDKGVVGDLMDPGVELLGGRQGTVQEQVRHLEVSRVLGELLDGIAAVLELARVTVDERDRALSRSRRHEGWVVQPYAWEKLGPRVGGDSAV